MSESIQISSSNLFAQRGRRHLAARAIDRGRRRKSPDLQPAALQLAQPALARRLDVRQVRTGRPRGRSDPSPAQLRSTTTSMFP